LAAKCVKANLKSPIGDLSKLLNEDDGFKEFVDEGHLCIILPESLSKEEQGEISTWRNQDQNDNQQTHEVEQLQTIMACASDLSRGEKEVSVALLSQKSLKRNPCGATPEGHKSLCQYVKGFLDNDMGYLVHEVVDYHSTYVNPRELTITNAFFHALATEDALKQCPYTRHYLILTQYGAPKQTRATSPVPTAAMIEVAAIPGLCKKPEILKALETKIGDLRTGLLPILDKALSPKQARLEMAVYIDLIIRCIFNKAWPESLGVKVSCTRGPYTEEKAQELGRVWAILLDLRHPGLDLGNLTGFMKAEPVMETGETVNLRGLRSLTRTESAQSEQELKIYTFATGDAVTVIRKMTGEFPTSKNPGYRKNLDKGLEGIIVGWDDAHCVKIIVKFMLSLDGGKTKECTHTCTPRNLQLTSEFTLAQAASVTATKPGVKPSPKALKVPDAKWYLETSDPGSVKEEAEWSKEHLNDADTLTKVMMLKSRCTIGLEFLEQETKKFTDKDWNITQHN